MELPLGGFEHLVGRRKPGIFRRLVAEGLGRADAGQAGFDLRVDVAGFLLDTGGGPGQVLPHGENHNQENRDHHRHNERQPPLDRSHHNQRADDGNHGGQQVLRAVVGKLRQLKQVGGEPVHQLAGPVTVVKIEAHLLHMPEQVRPDVRFHPDAEGMAVIAYNIIQSRPQDIAAHHDGHDDEKRPVHPVRQHFVQGAACHQRERKINQRNHQRAGNVQGKQFPVALEIAEKNGQWPLGLILFGGHCNLLLLHSGTIIQDF